jgi:DNA-binding Lrp family transcriptional regulator
MKIGKGKGRQFLPEELLSREEAKELIEAAEHPRNRAYVAVTDENGARPQEILSARIRSVQFDQYGAVLIVGGKTGGRRIRLITSAPHLAMWLDNHPQRDSPSSPIWINIGTTRHGGIFDYNAARKLLREHNRSTQRLRSLTIVVVLVRARYGRGYHERIGRRIAAIPDVWAVYYVLGDNDFVLLIRANDREDYMRKLEELSSMRDIERTSTQVVAKVIKEDPRIIL